MRPDARLNTVRARPLCRKVARQHLRRGRADRIDLGTAQRVDRRETLHEARARLARLDHVFQDARNDARGVHGRRALHKAHALGIRVECRDARGLLARRTQRSELAADLRLDVVRGGGRRWSTGLTVRLLLRLSILFAIQRGTVLGQDLDEIHRGLALLAARTRNKHAARVRHIQHGREAGAVPLVLAALDAPALARAS